MSDHEADSLYSQDFQRALLKIMATNTTFTANFGTLVKDEYFDSHALKVIMLLVREYSYTYSKELDLTGLSVEVENYCVSKGLADEVAMAVRQEAKIIMKTHIPSEEFYTDNLIKFARRQELKSALFRSVEVLEKDGNYDSVLHMIDQAVAVGSGNDTELTFNDLHTLPLTYMKKYDPSLLIPTGFKSWDHALEGGMAPGEVHVVLAPPKAGKSSTMVNTGAANIALGKNVFHITLEISKEDVGMKYAMCMSGMDKQQITTMPIERYHHKMKRYEKVKPNLFINFWAEGSINTMTIRSWISRVRARTSVSPDLIIIDYDDCLLPTTGRSKDDMYGDAGQVYSDLIGLANYFKCPILTAAQPQRDSWEAPNDGRLITHDKLAHSAKKAHKCWSITSLNFANDSCDGILFVDIARRGESKVKVKVIKDLMRCWVKELG